MRARKLFVLLLSALFLVGTSGLAVAAEPAPAKAVGKYKNANGTIKAATATGFTVVGKGKQEWTFEVDANTVIKKAGKAVAAAELNSGDRVYVQYTEAGGKLVATKVTVRAGGTAKKAEKAEKKEEYKPEKEKK